MSREEITAEAVSALRKRVFSVNTFFGSNSCFDIIAKNDERTMLVKVYENIDSIRKEQAGELKKLARVLGASCIIIGEKTKVFGLDNDVVYFRYDVPTVTIGTFEKILENKVPTTRYFKGKSIVDIDFGALHRKRDELRMSLEELAEKLGLASETLYRFEKGASTSLETAQKMEKELGENLVKKIEVLDYRPEIKKVDDIPDEKLLEKIHELGVKMALFEHAPFHAYGDSESKKGMFITTGRGKSDIPKKAAELRKTTAVIDSDSIIITKEYKYKSVEGVPVIEEADLDTISRVKELKKLIHEREKHG